jgi:hypothetical protein
MPVELNRLDKQAAAVAEEYTSGVPAATHSRETSSRPTYQKMALV